MVGAIGTPLLAPFLPDHAAHVAERLDRLLTKGAPAREVSSRRHLGASPRARLGAGPVAFKAPVNLLATVALSHARYAHDDLPAHIPRQHFGHISPVPCSAPTIYRAFRPLIESALTGAASDEEVPGYREIWPRS